MDLKGQKKTFYIKKVEMTTDKIMHVEEKTRLEIMREHSDHWPCLKLRKRIYGIGYDIHSLSLSIVQTKIFEYGIIVIIGANCMTLTMQDNSQDPTTFDNVSEIIF